MSWQASVDRVLVLRQIEQLQRDKEALIEIVREVEIREQVVVNREKFPVLRDVPTWKDQPAKAKRARWRGGMRTWAESKRVRESGMRVETDKRARRVREIEQVLSGNLQVQARAEEPAPQEEKANA